MNIIKSPNDQRLYKSFILDNELQVLLIIDNDTDISASSLTVNVGNYYDPNNYHGIAHFLEHMLFMGTKKYPNENKFFQFLNDHGGSSNAYTSEEITNYFFDIQSQYFNKGLDIFSQFFIDPLLKKNSIDREINAVDSEHSKNYNSDPWRLNRMLKEISNKEHPFYKFGTGNHNTLNKKDIRDVLQSFYNKYYSSNIMKLVVLHNKDIQSYISNLFSQIKNKKVILPKINIKPFNRVSNEFINLVKMVPINDEHVLNIIWQFPNLNKYYHIKPLNYYSYLLGHESEGSILYNLKNIGWATSLYSGIYEEDQSMNMLIVSITLTNDGFNYIPTIIDLVYDYLKLITTKGINKNIYNEILTMKDINFKFIDKINPIDYVSFLSPYMYYIPIKYILYHPYYLIKYNNKVESILKDNLEYIERGNSIIIISSRKYDKTANRTESMYNIKYRISHDYGKEFRSSNMKFNLHLPVKNIYIPRDLSIISTRTINKYPIRIINKDNINIWYKEDNKFKKPTILFNIIIYCQNILDNISNYVSSILYIKILLHNLICSDNK
jgi:insulysin